MKNLSLGLGDLVYFDLSTYLACDSQMSSIWSLYNSGPLPEYEPILALVLSPQNLLQKTDIFLFKDREIMNDISYKYLIPTQS